MINEKNKRYTFTEAANFLRIKEKDLKQYIHEGKIGLPENYSSRDRTEYYTLATLEEFKKTLEEGFKFIDSADIPFDSSTFVSNTAPPVAQVNYRREEIDIDALKIKIKSQIEPEDLAAQNVIQLAKDGKSYICPDCKNGTGDTGNGMNPTFEKGVWLYKCFKCGKGYDNIRLLAMYYGLDTSGKDFVELCKRAANDFLGGSYNISDYSSYTEKELQEMEAAKAKRRAEMEQAAAEKAAQEAELKAKEIPLIKATIDAAKNSQIEMTTDELRGIPARIFREFKCGIVADWVHPKIIAEFNAGKRDKLPPPTRRLIIPTVDGLHYNAVLSPADRTESNKNFWKMHAGKKDKCTFGLHTLTAENKTVFVTEGEIDAMSMHYAWNEEYWDYASNDYNAGFIAILGAAATAWHEELDKVFGSSQKKPLVIFVADNDDTGRTQAEKHRAELLKRGYSAVVNYFSDGAEKVDANDFLRKYGFKKLADTLDNFRIEAIKNLPAIEKEIEEMQKVLIAEREKAAAEKEKIAAEKAAKEKAQKEKEIIDKVLYQDFSDLTNARRLMLLYGDFIRYSTDPEMWLSYETNEFGGGIWKGRGKKDSALYPFAVKMVNFIDEHRPKFHYINTPSGVIQDTSKPQAKDAESVAIGENLLKNWKKTKNWNGSISALKGFDAILIKQEDLDKNPMLLNVLNGVVDLETGKFYPAAPELLLSRQCNAAYIPGATSPVFEKFMQDILPDEQTRAAVLRFLGYCLTGRVNEHKILFVLGSGANGKGTLFETIHYLLNDYATSFDVELILKRKFAKDPNSASPEIAKLEKVRFAYAPEIPAGRELDLAITKSLSGGDRVPARLLHQNPRILIPTWKLLISGQYLPKIENPHDIGLLRRLIVVKFLQCFIGDKADPYLKDKLRTADSLAGILATLVQEAIDFQKFGLIISDSMLAARDEYIEENDFIKNFIDDNCEFVAGASIIGKDFITRLKQAYSQAYRFSDQKLYEMIEKVEGITSKRSNGYKRLYGVKWIDSAEQGNFGGDFCPPPNF